MIFSHRCVLHPAEKKIVITNNKALSYAAAMNISLFYYKLLDDVNDEKLQKLYFSIILSSYKKKFSSSVDKINYVILKIA